MNTLLQDIRYGLRMLRKSPGFTAVAALSLAIGIGANITIFTVANSLLFRPPVGVVQPDRLVDIGQTDTDRGGGFSQSSYLNYLDVRQRAMTLEGVYGYQPVASPMGLGSPDGAERILGSLVTTNYFSVLGVHPAAGRLFSADDSEAPGASPIVVLSHSFWMRHFNKDPSVVGQTLLFNGYPLTVVGVASEGFHGTSITAADVWAPVGMVTVVRPPGTPFLTIRELPWLTMGGRLKPGVSVAQAAAELDAIGRVLEREYPDQNRGKGLRLLAAAPIPGNIVPVAGFLALLMGIVSLVLIIACANVAGVMLARATARRQEIAVRLAIGAGRVRLVRQLLTETIMLFVLGGAAGLLLARVMTSLIVSLLPTLPVPVDVTLTLDGRVIAFTTGLMLITALLSGLVPALQASKVDVISALRNDVQGWSSQVRLRKAFVICQVGISIVLVVGTGLFSRALQRASSIDPGFDPYSVELASLDLSLAGYTDTTGRVFARELVDRVRTLPGVQNATMAHILPMGGRGALMGLAVPGATPPNGQRFFNADQNIVEPGYFTTMHIPLMAGRDFSDADRDGAPSVAIVSDAAARRFWPGQDAIGKYLLLEAGPWRRPEATRRLVVIGVSRDVKSFRDNAPRSLVYMPLQQQYNSNMTLVVRTTQGERITGNIRELVRSMNPNLPIVTAQTLEDLMAVGLLPQRIAAAVSGSLGIVGLLLATIGIYGVTAYVITRRTHEIGIRIALGAQRVDIVGMVLRQGMSLVAIGSVIGLILAAAGSLLLTAWLIGVPPIDPVTFGGAAVLFALVGLAACYLPARRATRIDPMVALRYE